MAGTLHETLKPITSRRGAISLDYPTLGETGGAIGPSPQLSSSPAQLNIGGSSGEKKILINPHAVGIYYLIID